MPLRSLRTRLVALFLVSLTIAAFLFAAVALRQFTQEERSRARSDLSRQSLQIVKLIEEFAEKRLNGEAGAPPDFATSLGGITNTNVYFVGRGGLSAPIDEVNFGQAPKGTEERLNWSLLGKEGKAQTLNLKLADGTSTIAAAAGFRYGKPLIGAIVVARPCARSTPRRSCRGAASCRRCCWPWRPRRSSLCCSAGASRARCAS